MDSMLSGTCLAKFNRTKEPQQLLWQFAIMKELARAEMQEAGNFRPGALLRKGGSASIYFEHKIPSGHF